MRISSLKASRVTFRLPVDEAVQLAKQRLATEFHLQVFLTGHLLMDFEERELGRPLEDNIDRQILPGIQTSIKPWFTYENGYWKVTIRLDNQEPLLDKDGKYTNVFTSLHEVEYYLEDNYHALSEGRFDPQIMKALVPNYWNHDHLAET